MYLAEKLAENLQEFEPKDILREEYLMEDFDEKLFNYVLNSLTLENLRIYLFSKSMESQCDKTEPIYGTKYTFDAFSP